MQINLNSTRHPTSSTACIIYHLGILSTDRLSALHLHRSSDVPIDKTMNGYDNHAGPSRGRVHAHLANHPLSAPPTTNAFKDMDEDEEQTLDVIPSRAGRKLCVRHKQMANQNVNAKLQKVSTA